VLIVAPTGRDAAIVTEVLNGAGIRAAPCGFAQLLEELKGQAIGALIVAEEALRTGGAAQLAAALRRQPAWSDLPLVLLLGQHRPRGVDRALATDLGVEGLALLLERPLRKSSLISTVKMALRGRRRQYEVRDLLNAHVRAAVELTRADRSKDEFLAMLAHELRNPLGPIRNAGVLLQRMGGSNESIGRMGAMITRQSAHMTRLLDGLLDVSRITRGTITLERKTLDAAAIALDALDIARPLIELRKHSVQLRLPAERVAVEGDETRLTQVLGNLLINSAKYTPEAGEIVLTLEETGDAVTYRVRDNGAGIDAALLPRIFDLFSQAETELDRPEGGLGIGLAVVKGIVELHGGSVAAESGGHGRGAEFVVQLPRGHDVNPVQDPLGEAINEAFAPRRILIVDDNRDLAESGAMLLREEGHEVCIASDGISALDLAAEFGPDAALLDIGLPGLNGYELARELRTRQNGEDLLLIAVTGYGQPEDRERAQSAGFDFHMVKPLDPSILSAVLRQPMNGADV
jgi:signal transduction histidine kinase/ActR/RegA family two-component response regulator